MKNQKMFFVVKLVPVVLGILVFSGCALLDRSMNSGYQDISSQEANPVATFYADRNRREIAEAQSELGIPPGMQMNEIDKQAVRNRILLRRLERGLTIMQEREQYYAYKPYLRSDVDRIEFLRSGGREAKELFVKYRGLASAEKNFDGPTVKLIDANDIAKGMSREAVRQSWGEPDNIEVSGSQLYGNERWNYSKLVSTDSGYKHETRIIYFESGRVAGWESTH
jgi:hypothetical protein